jgi:hypothetical protein
VSHQSALLALAMTVGWVGLAQAQAPRIEPQVQIVEAVGCAEARGGNAASWWLTRAVEPSVSRAGVFNETQVQTARAASLGTAEVQLIGFADFVDAESLLATGDRARFTDRDQVNATNQLRRGNKVLVKGLLIESGGPRRINLLAVVALAETCG